MKLYGEYGFDIMIRKDSMAQELIDAIELITGDKVGENDWYAGIKEGTRTFLLHNLIPDLKLSDDVEISTQKAVEIDVTELHMKDGLVALNSDNHYAIDLSGVMPK